jgi:hypothetical protein
MRSRVGRGIHLSHERSIDQRFWHMQTFRPRLQQTNTGDQNRRKSRSALASRLFESRILGHAQWQLRGLAPHLPGLFLMRDRF